MAAGVSKTDWATHAYRDRLSSLSAPFPAEPLAHLYSDLYLSQTQIPHPPTGGALLMSLALTLLSSAQHSGENRTCRSAIDRFTFLLRSIHTQILALGLYIFRIKQYQAHNFISIKYTVKHKTNDLISQKVPVSLPTGQNCGSVQASTPNTQYSSPWSTKFRRASHLHTLSPRTRPYTAWIPSCCLGLVWTICNHHSMVFIFGRGSVYSFVKWPHFIDAPDSPGPGSIGQAGLGAQDSAISRQTPFPSEGHQWSDSFIAATSCIVFILFSKHHATL